MTGDVRKRRGKRKSAARDDKKNKENNNKAPPPKQQLKEEEEEETAWQTVKNHPLVMVLPIVLIPYALYLSYLYLQLQRPDIVETATFGLLPSLRPAVTSTEKRQVLIVGTMSSGTVQVAHDLSQQLQLEVGHELVDATWNFCRDGTVSWFHGIRFLQPLDTKDLVTKWSLLCGNNYTENMGFHPNMYTSSCSSREKWSKCWSNACLEIFQQEWGCAWNQKNGCATPPFETTLLQVRNPMHTISSLVTKFCVGGMNGTIHSSFLPFASAFFPFHNFTNDSCIEAMGTFVVEYNTALLKAKDAGLVTEMYRVEETSACQVAHLAGLGKEETTVYPPNFNKVARICNNDLDFANRVMESTQHFVNQGQVSLAWEDLRGGRHGSTKRMGDVSLEKSVRKLFSQLGYDPSTVNATNSEASGEFS